MMVSLPTPEGPDITIRSGSLWGKFMSNSLIDISAEKHYNSALPGLRAYLNVNFIDGDLLCPFTDIDVRIVKDALKLICLTVSTAIKKFVVLTAIVTRFKGV
jgi:hypothetical protein